jgi:T5SS/PEP-CTERM-associated repeat protein/autotransporter-associated beta strand protein
MKRPIHRAAKHSMIGLPLALTLLVAAPPAARAQTDTTYIWTGTGAWYDFFGFPNRTNWLNDLFPISAASTALDFTGSSGSSNDNGDPFTLNRISFDVGSDFQLTGNTLIFDHNGALMPALYQNTQFNVGISNNLTLNSALTVGGTGTGNLTLYGTLSGPGGLIQTGNFTTFLANTGNSYLGGTSLDGGILNIEGDGSLGAIGGGLTFNGGTLQWASSFDLNEARTITLQANGGTFDTNGFDSTVAQAINGVGGLDKVGAGTLTLTGGTAAYPGSFNNLRVDGGALTLSGANLQLASTTSDNNAAFVLNNTSATIQSGAQVNVNANGYTLISGSTSTLTVTDAGTALNAGKEIDIGLNPSGGTSFDTGYLNVQNGGSVSVTGDIVFGHDSFTTGYGLVDGAGSLLSSTNGTVYVGYTPGYIGGFFGSGDLTVQNGGKVAAANLMVGNNTSTNGVLTVQSGGTVTLNSTLSIGATAGFQAAVSVTGAGSLVSAAQLQIGSQVGSTGSLTIGSGGAVQISGMTTLGTTLSFQPLIIINTGSLVTGSLGGGDYLTGIQLTDPAGGTALTVGGDNSFSVYGGYFTGSGSLTKIGTGTLVLPTNGGFDAVPFTGSTTINGGSIELEGNSSFVLSGSTVAINVDNGLALNAIPMAMLGGLSGNGALNLGSTQLAVGNNNSDTTYSGLLSATTAGTAGVASGGLDKIGAGTLTLTGGTAAYPGSFNNLRVDGGALTLSGANLQLASTATDSGAAFVLNNNAAVATVQSGAQVNINSSGHTLINGALTVTDPGSLLNAGQLMAIGLNSGTGSLTVRNGGSVAATDEIDFGAGQGSVGSGLIDGAGSSLSVATGLYVGASGSGSLTMQNGGAVMASQMWVGFQPTAGSSASLTVQSGGTLTLGTFLSIGNDLGGNAQATVTGKGSLITTPQLYLGGTQDPDTGQYKLTISDGGSVQVGGFTDFTSSPVQLIINGGTLITGGLASAPGIAPTIQLTDPAGGAALTVGVDNSSSFFHGTITGTGSLVKLGVGAFTMTGNNTYTGLTSVQAGTLNLTGGTSSGPFNIARGASLVLDGATVSLGYGHLRAGSGSAVYYLDGATLNGGYLEGTGMQTITYGGANFNGVTAFAGVQIQQNDLTAFNDVTSAAAIASNAELDWTGGLLSGAGSLTINTTARFSGVESDGVLTIAAGATLSNPDNSLTLGGGSRTYIGSKDSPGGLLSLAGNTVELNGGLLVNNGTIDGLVDINYGGLAKGAGDYAGGYNINTGGNFIPGNSPGTLLSGSATWNAGGKYTFQIDDATGAAGTNWGLNQINGTLTLNAGKTSASLFTLALQSLGVNDNPGSLIHFDPTHNYTWTFVTTTQGIVGFDPAEFNIDASGFSNPLDGGYFDIFQDGNQLDVDFVSAVSSVPEASSLLTGGIILFGGGLLLRRDGRGRS